MGLSNRCHALPPGAEPYSYEPSCSTMVAHLFSVKSLVKHCPEKLRTILKLLWGVPVVLTVALWIRSCSFRDSIYFSTPTWGGVVSSSAGKLAHGGAIWTRPQGWSLEIQSIVCPDMDRLEPDFRLHTDRSGWEMSVPHWLLVLVFGLPLLVHHMFEVRQRGKADTHRPNESSAATANPDLRLSDSGMVIVRAPSHARRSSWVGSMGLNRWRFCTPPMKEFQ